MHSPDAFPLLLPFATCFGRGRGKRVEMGVFGVDPAALWLGGRLAACVTRRPTLGAVWDGAPPAAEEAYAPDAPVHGSRPVREEDEKPHCEDAVPAYSVVGVGEIDTGDTVVEPEGEKGCLAEQECGECALGRGEGEECWVC